MLLNLSRQLSSIGHDVKRGSPFLDVDVEFCMIPVEATNSCLLAVIVISVCSTVHVHCHWRTSEDPTIQ